MYVISINIATETHHFLSFEKNPEYVLLDQKLFNKNYQRIKLYTDKLMTNLLDVVKISDRIGLDHGAFNDEHNFRNLSSTNPSW